MIELVAALTVCLEACAAIYRAISAGLERNLSVLAAAVTDYIVHLTLATICAAIGLTTSCTACGATAGLILEALVSIELLLRSGKNEFCVALTAYQSLVFEHGKYPPKCMCPYDVFPCCRVHSHR